MSLLISQQIKRPEDLEKFLERILEGLKEKGVNGSVLFTSPEDFTHEKEEDAINFPRDKAFVINLYAKKSGEIAPISGDRRSLTPTDVLRTLQQVYNVLASSVEFQTNYVLPLGDRAQLFKDELRKIFLEIETEKTHVHVGGDAQVNKDALHEIAEILVTFIREFFAEREEVEETEKVELREEIPEWLETALEKDLRRHWKVITELISLEDESGYLEKALREHKNITKEEDFPGVLLRNDEEILSLIALRRFLNEWAEEILEEDENWLFPSQHIFSEENHNSLIFFPESKKYVGLKNQEIVQEEDRLAVESFKKHLLRPLKKFEETKLEAPTPPPTNTQEDGGSEDQAERQPLTEEQGVKLKNDIVEYQHYIKEESLRLQVIATNFVLAVNNFPPNIPNELSESEVFKYMQREINTQILDLLNKDPHALDDPNKRAALIHSFLFRLFANPRFQTYLALVKEKYAAIEVAKFTKLTGEEEAEFKRSFIEQLENKHNKNTDQLLQDVYLQIKTNSLADQLTDVQQKALLAELEKRLTGTPNENLRNIDRILNESYAAILVAGIQGLTPLQQRAIFSQLNDALARNPQANTDNFILAFSQRITGTPAPSTTFDPQKLQKGDFEDILKEVYKLNAEQVKAVLDGADLLTYLRISPDRLSRFTLDQNNKIFDDAFKQLSAAQQSELSELLAEYILLRRSWFEKQYNAESVSQAQDAENGTARLTDDELKFLLAKKELFKNNKIDPKHFVRASLLTPVQLQNFASENKPESAETVEAARILKEERAALYVQFAQQLAMSDPVAAEMLLKQVGINFLNANLPPSVQDDFLYKVESSSDPSADFSPYEQESGLVVDNRNLVIRGAAAAEAIYKNGGKARPAVTPLKAMTDEGRKLIGKSVTNAILPGASFFLPKSAQKKVGDAVLVTGGVAGATVVGTVSQFLPLLSGFSMVGMGGIAGSIGGAIIGAGGGPIGAVLGAAGGGIAGAGGAAFLQNGGLDGFGRGLAGNSIATQPFGVPGSIAAESKLAFSSKAGTFFKVFSNNPAAIGTAGFLGTALIGSLITYNQYAVAFLPPKRDFASGVENKYVVMTKVANPTKSTNPGRISYSIKIDAKAGYTVDITNITDTVTVNTKDKSTPTPPASPDFSQYKRQIGGATGNSSITIPYEMVYNDTFKDSLVTNTAQITFNVTGKGASVSDSTSAKASVCFGDCPAPAAGCWPMTATVGQGPYGGFTHGLLGEDAFDLIADVGTPIYAPFSGNLCAAYEPGSVVPVDYGYGYYLKLTTDDGNIWTFGHLSSFAPGIIQNNCSTGAPKRVVPGDLVGFSGNTGFSTGPHLHYQIGPEGNTSASIIRNFIPPADRDVKSGDKIVSCYDTGASPTQ